MRGTLTARRLLDGSGADEVARAAAWHLASVGPPGVVGALAPRSAPVELTIVAAFRAGARAEETRAALAGLAERLAGRAERTDERDGDAWDLRALAAEGGVALG